MALGEQTGESVLPGDAGPGPGQPADSGDSEHQTLSKIKRWHHESQRVYDHWAHRAKQAYDFVNLHQWTDEDLATLREQDRPVITFDRIGPIVDVVQGMEVNNRQEITYKPRGHEDAAVAETAGFIVEHVRDEADAEDAENYAFRDLIIGGMGWVECLPGDPDDRTFARIDRTDPFEMRWQPGARKLNLEDSRYVLRVKSVDRMEAMAMFPGRTWQELDAEWARERSPEGEPRVNDPEMRYRHRRPDDYSEPPENVTLVEAQWIDHEWITVDPDSGEPVRLDEDKAGELLEAGYPVRRIRVVRWATAGNELLDLRLVPTTVPTFTYKCMTGKYDRREGIWYGLVRSAIDPQKYANKWLAMSVEILAAGAKGGVMYEADAVDDPDAFRNDWANPRAATQVNPGTLQNGKIQPRPVAGYPTGWDRLLDLALRSIRDSTGVNLEILGLREVDQPGVLEYQRKQAAVTILAVYFDALRRMRKAQGALLLDYVLGLMRPVEMARILGPDRISGAEKQEGPPQDGAPEGGLAPEQGQGQPRMPQNDMEAMMVPAIAGLLNAGAARYDVIVDEAPSSANAKERTWFAIQPMLPMLARMELPVEVWLEIVRMSPLPQSFVEKIAQHLDPEKKAPDPQAMLMQQLALAAQQAQIEGEEASAEKDRASAEKFRAEAAGEKVDTRIAAQEAVGNAAGRMMEIASTPEKAEQERQEREERKAGNSNGRSTRTP